MSAPDDPIPDNPIPDDKDWTWVLRRPCPECGFDASAVDAGDVASLLRSNTATWVEILCGEGVDETAVRRRPSSTVWSPLEYACHVRDVHVLYLSRLEMMLEQDGPQFPNWNQDATALDSGYRHADPAVVAVELRGAADALAARFDRVSGAEWDRSGHRSDGASFTIASFAKYFIHDPIHHVHDVQAGGLS